MQDHIGNNVLVTTDRWFTAPDGKEYKAVWGKLKAIHESGKTLGFIPNRSHANWFIEIGDMIIMGCQVMYFIKCEEKPNTEVIVTWTIHEGKVSEYKRPCTIYISK